MCLRLCRAIFAGRAKADRPATVDVAMEDRGVATDTRRTRRVIRRKAQREVEDAALVRRLLGTHHGHIPIEDAAVHQIHSTDVLSELLANLLELGREHRHDRGLAHHRADREGLLEDHGLVTLPHLALDLQSQVGLRIVFPGVAEEHLTSEALWVELAALQHSPSKEVITLAPVPVIDEKSNGLAKHIVTNLALVVPDWIQVIFDDPGFELCAGPSHHLASAVGIRLPLCDAPVCVGQ
mmetsp:Transcript_67512/g.144432  ORF Transcript_67512/g.144432 Transcript_67512/m.144432 type:complete len:238 (-) Transcript_67512:625-1338(-)